MTDDTRTPEALREATVADLAAHLHRKGVGCEAHRGDDRAVADETHRDDAYDIYDRLLGDARPVALAAYPVPDSALREAAAGVLSQDCCCSVCNCTKHAAIRAALATPEPTLDPEELARALHAIGPGDIEAMAWSPTELPVRYIGDEDDNVPAEEPYPMASLARAILDELARLREAR